MRAQGTRIVAGIISDRAGRILICQRKRGAIQELKWEFPGGKVEPGEQEMQALERELAEELGIRTEIGDLIARVRHRYAETGELELAFYRIDGYRGRVRNRVFAAIAWASPEALSTYDFLAADLPVIELLRTPA